MTTEMISMEGKPIDVKTPSEAPLQRLAFFREKLGLEDDGAIAMLDPYRERLIAHKDEFADYLYEYFIRIPETKSILSHETWPKVIKNNWSTTFDLLFSGPPDEELMDYLWKSGVIHVRVNIDQRFINLGYALMRTFCLRVVREVVDEADAERAADITNRLLDLCVLIATDAYLDSTTKCDREVVRGIAHQLRNPLMIIGGYTRKLQKAVDPESPDMEALRTILEESKRLEKLVADVSEYMDLYREDAVREALDVQKLLDIVMEQIRATHTGEIPVRISVDPAFRMSYADRRDISAALRHMLLDALETIEPSPDGGELGVSITTRPDPRDERYMEIVFFSTGESPRPEELDILFTPFHARAPMGAGFGLPIARLAANKNLGRLGLTPIPGKGLECAVSLPKPPQT
ncbi:histidine kinase dimerization/phospho-acceptor domain-containing protein [Oceanidesulfovibrio indonesiensis]|nr:histidine kinase dimerization/phospho-acceptor domain-containing protein [Oceanidesulfovibrio indonesiensis]